MEALWSLYGRLALPHRGTGTGSESVRARIHLTLATENNVSRFDLKIGHAGTTAPLSSDARKSVEGRKTNCSAAIMGKAKDIDDRQPRPVADPSLNC